MAIVILTHLLIAIIVSLNIVRISDCNSRLIILLIAIVALNILLIAVVVVAAA